MRSSPSPSPAPGDELRHTAAPEEEWVFTAWAAQPAVGVISGYRIVGGSGWYWAALARAGEPLLHVADWHVPLRANPLLVKGAGLWAEHTCDAPMEQWTVVNETYAAALDDPDDALGRAYGVPTALSWDLEWYATSVPRAVASDRSASGGSGQQRPAWPGNAVNGYQQAGVVHGQIEIGGARPVHLSETPAHRWHRWGTRLEHVALPEAFAHTGLRAPFAFPDGTVTDWVLTPDGWRHRR
jgi:hypothetical protein